MFVVSYHAFKCKRGNQLETHVRTKSSAFLFCKQVSRLICACISNKLKQLIFSILRTTLKEAAKSQSKTSNSERGLKCNTLCNIGY